MFYCSFYSIENSLMNFYLYDSVFFFIFLRKSCTHYCEEECERLAGPLYSKGLTQAQAGDVFNDIYGEHYSKTSISRMLEYLKI